MAEPTTNQGHPNSPLRLRVLAGSAPFCSEDGILLWSNNIFRNSAFVSVKSERNSTLGLKIPPVTIQLLKADRRQRRCRPVAIKRLVRADLCDQFGRPFFRLI